MNFTPYLGRSICQMSPLSSGSSGLYVRLIPKAGSDRQPINALITARHIIFDIDKPSVNHFDASSDNDEPTEMIQMTNECLDGMIECFQVVADTVEEDIRRLQRISDDRGLTFNETIEYREAQEDIAKAREFSAHCNHFRSQDRRRIGTVVASPSIGTFEGTYRDWAVIKLSESMFGSNIPANRVFIDDLPGEYFKMLQDTGCTTRAPIDTSDPPGWSPNFVELGTYFARAAISNSKEQVHVYKHGAISGTTHGLLNQVYSYHWWYDSDMVWDYCVLDTDQKHPFSQRGDSGSVVFAVLPAAAVAGTFPSPSLSSLNIRSTDQLVVGVVGFLLAGCRGPGVDPRDECDVSHVVPFDIVKDNIEYYTDCYLELGSNHNTTDEVRGVYSVSSVSSTTSVDSDAGKPSKAARRYMVAGQLSKVWKKITKLGSFHRK